MKLTAEVIESFSGVYLSPRYDGAKPTPDFHRECWTRYCSDHPACATAAPRNHAKSTALTHDYILANVLFRAASYIILVGATEELAIEHLTDISNELRENEDIVRDFKIKEFATEAKTDIVVECQDGYQFRIIARGAEQKIRGRKWRGKRPDLIVGDDLEDDEQVESKERRKKFKRWFFRACKQALSDHGRIRVHGTILHKDSLLNHLIHNSTWNSRCYKAHRAFSDFTQVLWPEKFSEERLRAIRQEFIDEGDSSGYSQEYLNDPRDDEKSYLSLEQFLPMKEEHFEEYQLVAVGADFAVSKADAANRTAFVVGGKTISNHVNHQDFRADRWDTKEWIDEMFAIQLRWEPEVWFVEDGVIWKAVWPTIQDEMRERDVWINFIAIPSTKDKASRGREFQKRMKSGSCRFNHQHSMYEEFKQELLDFSVEAEAILDDYFDATTILSRGLLTYQVSEEDQMTEEEIEFEKQTARAQGQGGRSVVTGY